MLLAVMMRRRIMSRMPLPTPAESGVAGGLAYTLWLPDGPPVGGFVAIHGAGSRKENHHDAALAARDAGFAAVAFDQRGHGESGGALDGRALDDVATIAELLPRPLALRGSSMGGYVAIAAAERAGADAVVAVCPAPAELLVAGIATGRLDFPVDRAAVEALLAANDLREIVSRSRIPLMLQHAQGDEQVPYRHSVELHELSAAPLKRLIVADGGHHRSVQHDPHMQGEALGFVREALAAA
jgi:pimeloyl-ACP methyl ester carboxylesterase